MCCAWPQVCAERAWAQVLGSRCGCRTGRATSPQSLPALGLARLPSTSTRAFAWRRLGTSCAGPAGLPVLSLEGPAADAGQDEATGETPCLPSTPSGTTGGPKLVLHDQQAIAGHATDVARRIGLDAADAALLGAVPFCGTFGNAAAMAAIAGGAHVV